MKSYMQRIRALIRAMRLSIQNDFDLAGRELRWFATGTPEAWI